MNGKNNSQTAGGNSEGFVDTETLAGLVTPQAQAVSEVSAVIGDCSYPTAFLQLLIEGVHLHAGLPWYTNIRGYIHTCIHTRVCVIRSFICYLNRFIDAVL